MGWFKNNGDDQKQEQAPRNPDTVLGIRLVAAAYILYLAYQSVQAYINGSDGATLLTLIISVVVLGGGAVFIAITSIMQWKRAKEETAQADTEEESTTEDFQALEEDTQEKQEQTDA